MKKIDQLQSLGFAFAAQVVCIAMLLGLSGCGGTRQLVKIPGVRAVSKSVGGLTKTVTRTGSNLYSGVKRRTGAVSKDVARYTTKLPGTRSTSVSERDMRAIADHRQRQAYQNMMRSYQVPSSALPRGGQVVTSP